ncbi:cellulose binding domain-containing protein [Actinokineospora guangxiensis]|uniref:Cellulose binding domain-containing protein n=1 Tax=Actinokineospora guangxiensis TaxID=1490288 RepID=A0ABW0EMT2_9PSEU
MLRKALLPALTAAFAVVLALLALPGTAAQTAAAPVRVMALGDSITGSPGCWRALLWDKLRQAGRSSDVDFVGSRSPDGCGFAFDGEHEGHGGILATTVASQNLLPGWLSTSRPDVVLMHFGTNDVWSNRPTAAILSAFDTLVAQMRAGNPSMRVLVAQILPMNAANCGECAQRVVALNAALPAWAAGKTTSRSPVTVVDQWTGFSTASDTYDGVHPNASGDRKIADRWYSPLLTAIDGAPPPVTTSTTSTTMTTTMTTTTTTTTPPPVGSCAVTVRVANRWQGGAQLEIVVTNPTTGTIPGWAVRFALRSGLAVSQSWNTAVTTAGLDVTASTVAWNRSLPPGGSTTAGMIVTGDSTGWTPVPICSLS